MRGQHVHHQSFVSAHTVCVELCMYETEHVEGYSKVIVHMRSDCVQLLAEKQAYFEGTNMHILVHIAQRHIRRSILGP